MHISQYLPIWDKLESPIQEKLSSSTRLLQYSAHTMIHDDHTHCTGLLLVKSGQLRAFIYSDEGKEITLYRLFDYDLCFFSASCIMNNVEFDISIEAEKDSEVYLIPTEVYRQCMESSAPLANYTNEVMSMRFSDVMWLLNQVLYQKMDHRLSAFLLEESQLENTKTLFLTHEDIAHHLGSAREVISRMLSYMQKEGLIQLSRNKITLLDEERLKELAGTSLR